MRIKLDKHGVAQIRTMCENRVNAVKQKCATEAVKYLVNFGYHVKNPAGPSQTDNVGWTWQYAASWSAGVNEIRIDVPSPARNPLDDPFEAAFEIEVRAKQFSLEAPVINSAKIDDVIFVTNPQYYGKWLNDGGELAFTFWRKNQQPNRFMELCTIHVKSAIPQIVNDVKKEVK